MTAYPDEDACRNRATRFVHWTGEEGWREVSKQPVILSGKSLAQPFHLEGRQAPDGSPLMITVFEIEAADCHG
jgi:hypothetical protein